MISFILCSKAGVAVIQVEGLNDTSYLGFVTIT